MKKKEGITLIALIITIIVLLILAGVSISMVVGENGIMSKAGKASEETKKADLIEKVQVEMVDNQIDNLGKIRKDQFLDVLNKYFKEVPSKDDEIWDTDKWKDEELFSIDDNISVKIGDIYSGELNETVWFKNDNGDITNGSITLKIGDYVNYNHLNGAETLSYVSNKGSDTEPGNGYSNQEINLGDYTDGWRVLGINEDGQIELISEKIVSGSDSLFCLNGKAAYQYGISELNKICEIFGQGDGAADARSITIEDINELTGYNPNCVGIKNPTEAQIAVGTKCEKDTIREYLNEVTYTWDETNLPKYIGKNGVSGKCQSLHSTKFLWWENNKWNEKIKENEGEICTVTSTYYQYYPETLSMEIDENASIGIARNSDLFDLIFGEDYWLASNYIAPNIWDISFGYFRVWDQWISGRVLMGSTSIEDDLDANGNVATKQLGIRPIVMLKSNINLKPGTDDSHWSIN